MCEVRPRWVEAACRCSADVMVSCLDAMEESDGTELLIHLSILIVLSAAVVHSLIAAGSARSDVSRT